jgi:Zn-dependent protease
MALLAAVPIRMNLFTPTFSSTGILPTPYQLTFEFLEINLLLMLFNLIPIAPLDGDKIAEYFFPPRWANALERIRPYGPVLLIVLVFLGPLVGIDLLGMILYPPMTTLARLLIGVPA